MKYEPLRAKVILTVRACVWIKYNKIHFVCGISALNVSHLYSLGFPFGDFVMIAGMSYIGIGRKFVDVRWCDREKER